MTMVSIQGKLPLKNVLLGGMCALSLSACSWFSNEPDEMAMTAPQQKEASVWNAPTLATGTSAPTALAANAPKGDVESRLANLENSVSGIRSDMNMMMPALTRLAEAQNNLQDVLDRIQPAAGIATDASAAIEAPSAQEEPTTLAALQAPEPIPVRMASPPPAAPIVMASAAPAVSAHPAAAPVAAQAPTTAVSAPIPMTQTAANQASPSGISVRQVRFGEHPGKTRLVLDLNAGSNFKYDIDNGEHLLMIDLPATAWTAAAQQIIAASPLVASYNASPDGKGGTRLAVQLKQAAQVGWAQAIASPETGGSRIVIDVMPL